MGVAARNKIGGSWISIPKDLNHQIQTQNRFYQTRLTAQTTQTLLSYEILEINNVTDWYSVIFVGVEIGSIVFVVVKIGDHVL